MFTTEGPPTAGSETPAGPSRRRSLPVPDGVEEGLKAAMIQIARAQKYCRDIGRDFHFDELRYANGAIFQVLVVFADLKDEAPEGNTQAEQQP